MTEFAEQLNRVHEASSRLINNSSARAEELIKKGNYKEAQATMNLMLDGITSKNNNINFALKQRSENVNSVLNAPPTPTKIHSPHATETILSESINKAKLTAIVAGAAVIGGGIILYRNIQHKKHNMWTLRIQQQCIDASEQRR